MTRTLRLTLVLTLAFCCIAALAMAAGSARPAGARGPAFHKAPAPAAPSTSAKTPQSPPALSGSQLRAILLADSDPDCLAYCSDQWTQCCTYGGCEQCSCQLALCRASCGEPYYGC